MGCSRWSTVTTAVMRCCRAGSQRSRTGSALLRRYPAIWVAALTAAEVEAAAQAGSEATAPDEEFWRSARVVLPQPRPAKRHQGIRLDAEVIDWFKGQGAGWQTRMNAVLKSYVETHRRQGPR
ncbi:BrnA antitoxin family protein [Rhodopila sp.]|uniref:BrnA antitoxin family protein n=1 Tax=Rhodopila sp. TaxID=2480087 RepID=UPI003D0F6BA4